MPRFNQNHKRYAIPDAAKELGLNPKQFKRTLRDLGHLTEHNGETRASLHMRQNGFMVEVDVPFTVGPITRHWKKIQITEKGMNFFWSTARESREHECSLSG